MFNIRFRHDEFEAYAKGCYESVPRCGGELLGYWMLHDGTRDVAFCLINFESLADYEVYWATLKADEKGAENFQSAVDGRFIMEENRTIIRRVEP